MAGLKECLDWAASSTGDHPPHSEILAAEAQQQFVLHVAMQQFVPRLLLMQQDFEIADKERQ